MEETRVQSRGPEDPLFPLQDSCLENSHGQRSLVGYGPWGHRESDMTEQLTLGPVLETQVKRLHLSYVSHGTLRSGRAEALCYSPLQGIPWRSRSPLHVPKARDASSIPSRGTKIPHSRHPPTATPPIPWPLQNRNPWRGLEMELFEAEPRGCSTPVSPHWSPREPSS